MTDDNQPGDPGITDRARSGFEPPATPQTEAGPPVPMPPPTGSAHAPAPTVSPDAQTPMVPPWSAGEAQPVIAVPQRPWRSSTTTFGVVVIALLGLHVVMDLFSIWNLTQLRSALDRSDGDQVVALADLVTALSLLSLALYVVTGVLFLVWLHRVWNSDRSDPAAHTRSSGWAVGGWFIPFANLVLGPRSVRDLWHGVATAQARRAHDPATGREPTTTAGTPRLVLWWWVSLVASFVVSLADRSLSGQANSARTASEAIRLLEQVISLETLLSLLTIVAAVLIALVIRRVNEMATT